MLLKLPGSRISTWAAFRLLYYLYYSEYTLDPYLQFCLIVLLQHATLRLY